MSMESSLRNLGLGRHVSAISRNTYFKYWELFLMKLFVPFPGGKGSACQCSRCKRHGKIPWRRKWKPKLKPIPVFLPGKFHGGLQSTGLQSRTQLSTHTGKDYIITNYCVTQFYLCVAVSKNCLYFYKVNLEMQA